MRFHIDVREKVIGAEKRKRIERGDNGERDGSVFSVGDSGRKPIGNFHVLGDTDGDTRREQASCGRAIGRI